MEFTVFFYYVLFLLPPLCCSRNVSLGVFTAAVRIVAVQVTLGAQHAEYPSIWLPELSGGTGKFAILVLFTQSSTGSDQSRIGDVGAAHSKTEL